jgi:hypothetical protein
MNIDKLIPQPTSNETFRRNRLRFVPTASGCYALTTFSRAVLYIGLAKNLQRRMNQHLDSPEKTCETPLGRAVRFFWFETVNLNKVERTWMNIHIQHEGAIPELNKVYSPTPV